MSSAQYDQALLANAPTATKAQRQEGYSTDLLDSPSGVATPPLSLIQVDGEHGLAHKEDDGAFKKPIPFFRTRKGIFSIVAVLVIVIIAAIIGGAVGGSVHHNQSAMASPEPSSGNGGLGTSNSTNSTQSSSVGTSNSTNSTQSSSVGTQNPTNSIQGVGIQNPTNSMQGVGTPNPTNSTQGSSVGTSSNSK